MWSVQTTLNLIRDLSSWPCLWDVRCPEYKLRSRKESIFHMLSKKYKVGPVEVEKKIQSLKTQFRREHKKFLHSMRSGSYPKTLWFGYEPLSFLLKRNGCRDDRDIDSTGRENIEKNSAIALLDCEFEDNSQLEQKNREDKKSTYNKSELKHNESMNEDLNVKETYQCMRKLSKTFEKRDQYSVYGEHIANRLRNCGRNNFEIATAQRYIDDICFKLTMGAYSQPSYSNSYDSHHTHINSSIIISADHPNYHYSDLSSPTHSFSDLSVHHPSSSRSTPTVSPLSSAANTSPHQNSLTVYRNSITGRGCDAVVPGSAVQGVATE